MTINAALKEYINRRGFKQQVIAEAVGMKMPTLNSILNGHARLPADVLVKACAYMRTTPNEVLGFQES